jgi:hypothetical protein
MGRAAPAIEGSTFAPRSPVEVMASDSVTSTTPNGTDDLLQSLVRGGRGRALRVQFAARYPDCSAEVIEEAIQYACKSFLTEADGITAPGQVYAWIRTAAHRSLGHEADRRHRELVRTIAAYEDGRASAEEVCWQFVHDRVVAHTPSFDWEKAELALLLDRVVAVSTDPKFSSSETEDVAAKLVVAAWEEREAAKRLEEKTHRLAEQLLWKSSPTVRILQGINRSSFPGLVGQNFQDSPIRQAVMSAAEQFSPGLRVHQHLAEALKAPARLR